MSDVPLTTDVRSDRLEIRLSAESTITLRRTDHSVAIRLGFGRSGVGPDVSVQPGAVLTVIDQQARLARSDPARWRAEVAAAIGRWDRSLDWCPDDGTHLSAALGALTHPLLTPLYQAGGRAIDDIPRWASPILRTTDPGTAARVLTGGSTTRRLTKSLAESLLPIAGRIPLQSLSLAVAARHRLGVDHLANVLDGCTTATGRRGESEVPVPSVEDVRAIEVGLTEYPADRCVNLLVDAFDEPDRLARALTQLTWIVDRAPRPLPQRLADLEQLCELTVHVFSVEQTPNPAEMVHLLAHLVGRRRAVLPAPATARRGAGAGEVAGTPRRTPATWSIPRALVPIAGHEYDGLRLLVPTSTAVLQQWGARLRNCLDTYGPAVSQGHSWLVGIDRDEQLVGCLEVDPSTRRIRQAHGPNNRALPRPILTKVVLVLTEHRIVI